MKLKIAIAGTRGIPNRYGGFEQIAAYLAKGLVEKGYAVTVYNSHRHVYQEKQWQGVQIVHRYDPEHVLGTAGQFIYDLNCLRHASHQSYDIILLLGYTSSSVWYHFFPKESLMICNMDGLEWARSKYNRITKLFLQYAEKLAALHSHYHIADALPIKSYLDKKYGINCQYIAYGAQVLSEADSSITVGFNLKPYQYLMLMARMEKENNIEMILDGYLMSGSQLTFLVVGNISNKFGEYLARKFASYPSIVFAGAIFDHSVLPSLTQYASIYFHGHSVGGTNPSLIEAMGAGAFIAAHDNQFNRSVLNEDALYFNSADSVAQIIRQNSARASDHRFIQNNMLKVKQRYNWNSIINAYETYFINCIANRKIKDNVPPIINNQADFKMEATVKTIPRL